MINLDFHSKVEEGKVKLSAIFKVDNFVYTTFDSNNQLLSHSSGHAYSTFDTIVNMVNPSITNVTVKTNHFGHFGDKERIPFESNPLFIDKMTGEDIWCAYESPFTHESYNVRHFSTILNHFYFLEKETVFHIHFDKSLMHFYIQKDGEMVLYNCFPFEKADDLLYYHSFIAQSLDIDTQKESLRLSGYIEPNSSAYFKLSPFHNKIEFVSPQPMKIKSERQDLKNHQFLDHYLNITCV